MKFIRTALISAVVILYMCACLFAAGDTGKYLAKFARTPEPWLALPANSEQRQPLYLGSTPREIVYRIMPQDGGRAVLYESLRISGENYMKLLRDALVKTGALAPGEPVEFEAWPVRDDYGQLTWAFGRWHAGPGKPWQRLEATLLPGNPDERLAQYPILPNSLNPARKDDFTLIFGDVLTLKSLNDKPLFGDCIWTTADSHIIEAWIPADRMESFREEVDKDIREMGSSLLCRVLPQPARLNGEPITFMIGLDGENALWPAVIAWKKEDVLLPVSPKAPASIKEWPKDFVEAYTEDVRVLDGEKEAVFPVSKRKETFTNKNAIDARNQLQDVVSYLEERYKELGIKTWRQDFTWRGKKQTNLMAVIPGSDPSLKPVLLADHIDTAFSQDVFEKTGTRVPSPGADDNAAATAALLRAAPVLCDMKLKHEVWLVHLTGAEFPADSLGARYFVSQMLAGKADIDGVVLLDMIGAKAKAPRLFQVNAGEAPGSLGLAKIAIDAAQSLAGAEPVLRTRFDEKSRLYDTDGLIFSDNGFPVIALTEVTDTLVRPYRRGHHYSTDTTDTIDWDYATFITKVAIETVATLAGVVPAAPVAAPGKAPDWSVIVYTAADDPVLSKVFNPRLKELTETPVPEAVELLIERDTEWPDGSARAVISSAGHQEFELGEQNSADRSTFAGFLKWARDTARGKYKVLIIQGSSDGWRGILSDSIIPGQDGKKAIMPLRDLAAAIRTSGLRPDVVVFDEGILGTAEAVEELKDSAPYLIVSQRATGRYGFVPSQLYKMFENRQTGAKQCAALLPEEYVKEFAHDGLRAEAEGRYAVTTFVSVDTAAWDRFSAKVKTLVDLLKKAGFREKLAAEPGWARAFTDAAHNVDIVEFLNRLPLLIEDPDVRGAAAQLLEEIGYPERTAADTAATIVIDPAAVRSFELRIEAYPYVPKQRALPDIERAWKMSNQDIGLPEGLIYDVYDFRERHNPKREFIVRGPEMALKRLIVLRPWLPGTQYVVLTTVDHAGQVTEKKLFRDEDYFSVKEFPPTSFMAGEAHSQGAPFVHGIGVALDPAIPDASAYMATAWNARTGWIDLFLPVSPQQAKTEQAKQ